MTKRRIFVSIILIALFFSVSGFIRYKLDRQEVTLYANAEYFYRPNMVTELKIDTNQYGVKMKLNYSTIELSGIEKQVVRFCVYTLLPHMHGSSERTPYSPHFKITSRGTVYLPLRGSFAANAVMFVLFGIFYSKYTAKVLGIIYFIPMLALIAVSSEYFKDKRLGFAEKKKIIFSKTKELRAFLLFSIPIILLLDIITGLVFPHFTNTSALKFSEEYITYIMPTIRNTITAAVFFTLETTALTVISKRDIRLVLAFILPAVPIYFFQRYIMYGSGYEILYRALALHPFVPFYSKLLFFSASFTGAFILYFVSSRLFGGSIYRRVPQSIVFALCASGLCCINGVNEIFIIRLL